jgi:hypothetical protein
MTWFEFKIASEILHHFVDLAILACFGNILWVDDKHHCTLSLENHFFPDSQ